MKPLLSTLLVSLLSGAVVPMVPMEANWNETPPPFVDTFENLSEEQLTTSEEEVERESVVVESEELPEENINSRAAVPELASSETFLSEMRQKVNSLGGTDITVNTRNVVCNMSAAIGCASFPKTIEFANRLASYSQASKWHTAAHEVAHIRHFDQWDIVNSNATYKSLFASNPEHLADCAAKWKGYSAPSPRYSCSTAQLNFASKVWNRQLLPPPAPVLNYTTVNSGMSISRVSGSDRYATSRSTADVGWSDGPLFIATGGNFADALSVVPAVKKENGNLILSKKEIDTTTYNYIKSKKVGQIYIIGSSDVISSSTESKLKALAPVTRIGGSNRYQTSQMITKTFFKESSEAFIATGTNFPDALSASHVAAVKGVPIIIVSDQANAQEAGKIFESIGVKKVYVAGGTSVVSDAVAKKAAGNATLTRVSGSNRYETSAKLEALLGSSSKTVSVALGTNFPDALSAGAVAAKKGESLHLARANCIPKNTYNAIKSTTNSLRLHGGDDILNIGTKTATRVCK